MYLSINQSIYLFIYPIICLSIYQSNCLFIYLSHYLSLNSTICHSIELSVTLSNYLSLYLLIYLSIYLSLQVGTGVVLSVCTWRTHLRRLSAQCATLQTIRTIRSSLMQYISSSLQFLSHF